MKNFIAFIKANTSVKSKLLLIFLFLILLPARSFYYQLNLPVQKPLVRAVNYQFSTPSNYPVNTFNIPAPYLSWLSHLSEPKHSGGSNGVCRQLGQSRF